MQAVLGVGYTPVIVIEALELFAIARGAAVVGRQIEIALGGEVLGQLVPEEAVLVLGSAMGIDDGCTVGFFGLVQEGRDVETVEAFVADDLGDDLNISLQSGRVGKGQLGDVFIGQLDTIKIQWKE
jgi:hypothetical protein